MTELEKGVIDAQNELNAAVAAARAGGYRVSWQVNGDGEHSVVMNGGPEPAAPAPAQFEDAAPVHQDAAEEDHHE